jgi:branched-subunit amino acid permease
MAGFLAPITAILGAIAGANLVLILLDMARTGSAEDRISAGMATNTRTLSAKSKSPTGAGMR